MFVCVQVHSRWLNLWARRIMASPEQALVPLKERDALLASKHEVRGRQSGAGTQRQYADFPVPLACCTVGYTLCVYTCTAVAELPVMQGVQGWGVGVIYPKGLTVQSHCQKQPCQLTTGCCCCQRAPHSHPLMHLCTAYVMQSRRYSWAR